MGEIIDGQSNILKAAYDIAAIVRFIGHHDDNSITGRVVDTFNDRAAETVLVLILNWRKLG
jgi:hypothetical protein